MLKQFFKYIFQSIAGMIGISVYILADTFFISVHSGADGLAVLNLILPVYGVVYAIGAMIGIGSATRFGINRAKGEDTVYYHRYFCTREISASSWRRCGSDCPWKKLSPDHADHYAIVYDKLYVYRVCPKRSGNVHSHDRRNFCQFV